MGNYISRSDAELRLRRNYRTLYTPADSGEIDTDIVDADIDAAEGTVDSYLAGRYTVPVTDAEALRPIKSWALTFLEEIAYGAIPGREVPKNIADRAKAAREHLAKVASGHLSLGSDTPAPERETLTADLVIEADTPVMGRTNLTGF